MKIHPTTKSAEAGRAARLHSIIPRRRESVLGVPIDAISFGRAADRIMTWAARGDNRSVAFCNVHSIVTARRDERHAAALADADMVTADGAPIAWYLRKYAKCDQERVSGPDIMLECCKRAADAGIPIFLCGSSEDVLAKLRQRLRAKFPHLDIAGSLSPPFGATSEDENQRICAAINDSRARIVWVAFGCPKQEIWIHAHRKSLNGVLIGVGAAFDFHAGVVKRAPVLMQRLGFEWLHRLLLEPRRLFARYATTNTAFIMALISERATAFVRASSLNEQPSFLLWDIELRRYDELPALRH